MRSKKSGVLGAKKGVRSLAYQNFTLRNRGDTLYCLGHHASFHPQRYYKDCFLPHYQDYVDSDNQKRLHDFDNSAFVNFSACSAAPRWRSRRSLIARQFPALCYLDFREGREYIKGQQSLQKFRDQRRHQLRQSEC